MIQEVSARDIAVSGLKAQRVRMNVIANNIANVNTTRTEKGGGAFRRQLAVFRGNEFRRGGEPRLMGVQVKQIEAAKTPLRMVYDPSHPDANADGYVNYPNVDVAVEMADLVSAQRGYEANLAVLASGKKLRERVLEMLDP